MKRYLCFVVICLCTLQGVSQIVTQCRYWINDNFSEATTLEVNSENISLNINFEDLSNGYYQINFQFKQSDGSWSSPATQWFFKGGSSANNTGFRYWLNDNFANAITVNSPIDTIDLHLPLADVPLGYYQANFQFRDKSGNWSSVVSSWVYKTNSNNQLVKACRYWFDHDVENAKTIVMQSSTYDPIITKMDVESLSLGSHTVNIQFQDDGGTWSSVVSSFIKRNEITNKLFIEPKLFVQKSVVNPGEIQVISGNDFTSGGQVNLLIQNSRGDIIASNKVFDYSLGGSFNYQLPILSSFAGGEYLVTATDATTGNTTPVIKFKVNNDAVQNLWVSEPSLKGNYSVNFPLSINWNAFVSATKALGKTGLVSKKYKIEYSKDNGGTWQFIETTYLTKAQSNQTNSFKSSYTFATAGNYIIKITDLDDLSDFNTTSFSVGSSAANGFMPSLEWDHSIPGRRDKPVGVAADGTARLFMKLTRDAGNTKSVKQINAQISPVKVGDNTLGTALLGKVLYATETNDYSLEGNSANSTTTSKVFGSSSANDFSFWYVAPDDFTQELNNQDAERFVKVTFNITYTDNTSTTKEVSIRIARPPLMLVHGLNGSANSFSKFKYNIDGADRYFIYQTGSDGIFKNTLAALNLKNYESFKNNADILLGVGDQSYGTQSFQFFIKQMNVLGFAANRVDYVCHSMGGSIARTVLSSDYDALFRPDVLSGRQYKNYSRGFINKLITINTPHNGSPIADFMADFFHQGNELGQYGKNALVAAGYSATDFLKGFFVRTGAKDFISGSYDVSPAVKDLQALHGGVVFKTTTVKNHFLGSNIDKYGILSAADFIGQLTDDQSVKCMLDIMKYLLPGVSKGLDLVTKPADLIYSINSYMEGHYGYYQFLSNSDFIVPASSQFPALNISNIPNIDNSASIENRATIGYGISFNHITVTDKLGIGTKVMQLLNSPINSDYFADQIAPNVNPNASMNLRGSFSRMETADSVINYIDTNYIRIVAPSDLIPLQVDSTVNFQISLLDTNNLKGIQFIFQGEYYSSNSKVSLQTFNIKIHSNSIGRNPLIVSALYDSSGYSVYHTDTTTFLVKSLDRLKGFYVTPRSRIYNKNEIFQPNYNAVFDNYVGVLNNSVEEVSFSIADTNVVNYVDALNEFVTKDTGTTYVLYHYKGFTDTSFVYVTLPYEYPDLTFRGKVLLQGAYNTSTGTMKNTLNTSGLLTTYAKSQPYNTNTFKYESNEHVTHDFFTAHTDIVDWVLVELRDSATPSKVIASRAALVREDGTIIETNGSATGIKFSNIPPGRYYVVIRHRNHLGIRSSSALDFSSGSASYDFTTSEDKCFQNQAYTSTVKVGNIWAMRAGNANSDNSAKYNGPGNDQNHILNLKLAGSLGKIFTGVYSPEDINMDGVIKWNGPGNDQNFLLNTILNGYLSTIYLEQL